MTILATKMSERMVYTRKTNMIFKCQKYECFSQHHINRADKITNPNFIKAGHEVTKSRFNCRNLNTDYFSCVLLVQ